MERAVQGFGGGHVCCVTGWFIATLTIAVVLQQRRPLSCRPRRHRPQDLPRTLSAALDRLFAYSGQLAAYADAITSATGDVVTSTWIHLPVLGVAVEVRVPT